MTTEIISKEVRALSLLSDASASSRLTVITVEGARMIKEEFLSLQKERDLAIRALKHIESGRWHYVIAVQAYTRTVLKTLGYSISEKSELENG